MVDFRPRSIPPVRPSSKKTEPLKRLGILENPREFFARLRKKKISGMVIVASVFLSLFVLGILFVGIIYLMFLRSLPPITDIENLTLPESSVIRDKNGNELYSIFSEKDGKRTFVPLSGVSQDVIDALISTEDKTFFENQGIDFRSLVRSVSNYVFGKTDTIKGTSTISQQLIKNTFLNNERSFARKIKEAYLSYRLNSEYSKEKILELYLNKISYGHNASGVEEASKIFFGKSAKDVGILGSTILASLPKGPTYFSPYNQRDRLMGNLYVYQDDKVEEKINLGTPESRKEYRPLINLFRERISGLQMTRINGEDVKICGLSLATLKEKYSLDSEGCGRFAYKDILGILNNIRIVSPDVPLIIEATPTPAVVVTPKKWVPVVKPKPTPAIKSLVGYAIEYNTGRKDFVAARMLEDDKITPDEFKAVILDGLEFQFQRNLQSIKYPHFVMYVQEYLTKKYGDDFFEQGGLDIYTSIDPKLQDKAEDLIKKQVLINTDKYGAAGAALVSMDNKTGKILSMVGWPDYDNDAGQGKVNMVTALRQPGSSFKPIVYALAMSKDAIGPETPIYDVDTSFGKWNPDNYDKKFNGRMKIKTALDYSRNIPAIKMFKVAGGESEVVKHARAIGINSLRDDGKYGMPLAIGTGELRPIELMQAYSVYANGGWRKEPNPILRITDKKGNIIDEYVESSGKYVFSDTASYLLSVILSDASSRPSAFWNNVLTLKSRPVAAKTGTSNKDVSTGGVKKILPRDLWTAGYTPQITTVVWAGNVDGTETKWSCDGLNCAAPIWNAYMEFAHKDLPVTPFKKPEGLSTATISTITGKLVSESTPESERASGLFAVKPTKYEWVGKEVQVDGLCNGKITDRTPPEAIIQGYLVDFSPIVESYDPSWVTASKKWASTPSTGTGSIPTSTYITSMSDTVCDRPSPNEVDIVLSSDLQDGATRPLGRGVIRVDYSSTYPIKRIVLTRNNEPFYTLVPEEPKTTESIPLSLNFGAEFTGKQTIGILVADIYGYSARNTATIDFWGKAEGPKISFENPIEGDGDISIYEWQAFNLRFSVVDPVGVSAVNLYLDGALLQILGAGNSFTVPFGADLSPGKYTLEVQAVGDSRQRTKRSIQVEVLRK